MNELNIYHKNHDPPTKCREVPQGTLEFYSEKLPQELLIEWQTFGWCGYGDGLLWTVNPIDYSQVLSEWIKSPKELYTVLRTAFGCLIYWDGTRFYLLNVINGKVIRFFHTVDLLFNQALCDDEILDGLILRKDFLEARELLGDLSYDECYGFFPAIALGGPGTIESLKKVRIYEHLDILRQLF